jgi:diguanylate cyclase (GGDEF)-like protein
LKESTSSTPAAGAAVMTDVAIPDTPLWADGDPPDGRGGLFFDPMLQEARASLNRRGPLGPMEFFWGSLAPFTIFASVGGACLLFVIGAVLLDLSSAQLLRVAGLSVVIQLVLLLPLEYYLIRVRLAGPIVRLQSELRGQLPWRPEGDLLLGSLRRTIEEVRGAARDARGELGRQQEKMQELQAQVDDQRVSDVFARRLADALRTGERLDQFAAAVTEHVREIWPAEQVLLLSRPSPDAELDIVFADGGASFSPENGDAATRYRKASLPTTIKEALRRGFYAEVGLPFTRDQALPDARSFVAISLEHRGFVGGVVLLATSELTPPSTEPLRRARPLLSLAFSRARYLLEMEDVAIRDPLTGAYTNDHFLSVLRHEVARCNRYSRPAACVLMDIDGLRRINDRHGAGFGDQVIAEVAQLVDGLIRSTDILARTSGGELALLLPETAGEAAEIVGERLRARVEEHPFILQRNQVERVTISLGIGVHPPHGVTALALVDTTRRALREAKSHGRNRVVVAAGPAAA